MTSTPLNPTILEPLFAPWQEPNTHCVRAEKTAEAVTTNMGTASNSACGDRA